MDFKVQIAKLDGSSSWRRWKRQMDLMLHHHEVSYIVVGKRLNPPTPPKKASPDEVKDYQNILKTFMKDDSLAQVLIVNALDDSHVELTATCNSACEI